MVRPTNDTGRHEIAIEIVVYHDRWSPYDDSVTNFLGDRYLSLDHPANLVGEIGDGRLSRPVVVNDVSQQQDSKEESKKKCVSSVLKI